MTVVTLSFFPRFLSFVFRLILLLLFFLFHLPQFRVLLLVAFGVPDGWLRVLSG